MKRRTQLRQLEHLCCSSSKNTPSLLVQFLSITLSGWGGVPSGLTVSWGLCQELPSEAFVMSWVSGKTSESELWTQGHKASPQRQTGCSTLLLQVLPLLTVLSWALTSMGLFKGSIWSLPSFFHSSSHLYHLQAP